ncbi:hypothetical protein B0J18DRAFT_5858 [Chaetomium sp. MPI-SDFR-AT-0129]|nr:hypothetical protein B0J18DRAFT_5858 [Chaetomium sp. MPI-SDFR-AT-0129]
MGIWASFFSPFFFFVALSSGSFFLVIWAASLGTISGAMRQAKDCGRNWGKNHSLFFTLFSFLGSTWELDTTFFFCHQGLPLPLIIPS